MHLKHAFYKVSSFLLRGPELPIRTSNNFVLAFHQSLKLKIYVNRVRVCHQLCKYFATLPTLLDLQNAKRN